MKFPDMLEVELGSPKYHDGGVSRNEMAIICTLPPNPHGLRADHVESELSAWNLSKVQTEH